MGKKVAGFRQSEATGTCSGKRIPFRLSEENIDFYPQKMSRGSLIAD
jgi:hypothetical protein